MDALFGFLGILLLLAGLLPIRVLPGFLRGRPRKDRRAMWVSGLIIVLIAGAFTPSDDESQQEVASNESKAAAAADPVATTSPLPQPAADGTPETTSAVQTTLGDAAPATPTETTATTSESRAATTTEAPLVGESSLDSPIQLGAVVQAGSWRLRVSACGVIPDNIDDSGETFPGGTITGNVCWSIQSTDAASLVMIVEESFNFDDDTRAFFALAN